MNLTLRAAGPDDARRLWEWANDPSVRAWSFDPEPIPWEAHLSWYGQRLASAATRFWMLDADCEPVGQIRYDRSPAGRTAQISFSVAAAHRGRGYGVALIERSRDLALAELDVSAIVALTIAGNTASRRAFERVGFRVTGLRDVRGRTCHHFIWPAEAAE